MRLVEYDSGAVPSGLFDALVIDALGTDGGIAWPSDRQGDAAKSVTIAGGRVIDRIGWNAAIERVAAMGTRPVILLDTRGVADEQIATTLASLDGLAAGRDLTIIAGIDEAQIDVVAAGLGLASHQILCAPRPADWITALAFAMAPDRLALHDRITETEAGRLAKLHAEVARITEVLAHMSQHDERTQPQIVADPSIGFAIEPADEPRVSAADIRHIVRARRMRDRHLGGGLFEDPAWDMMLDLYAAHLERAQVSVSSLCIAASVAPTTALRWIARLTNAGLFERRPDPFDRRRAFMSLSDAGLTGMHRYVVTVRAMGLPLV